MAAPQQATTQVIFWTPSRALTRLGAPGGVERTVAMATATGLFRCAPDRHSADVTTAKAAGVTARGVSAWRFVLGFGVVSLLADVVYEGARAVTGPFLASLGAGAALVGLITGLGEAMAFAGRLATGPLADRTRAYWPLTLAGYTLTVVAVPLLGFTAALWLAATLVIAERAGKAIRSPAKDVLLSHATAVTGRGRGFAVHEALDQIGAVLGPLAIAGILLLSGGDYRPAFWALALPGVVVLVLLLRLRARVPDPSRYEMGPASATRAGSTRSAPGMPRAFWGYLAFTVLTTLGFATFGVLAFHLATREIVSAAAIPVIYAAAMGVDAVAAVITGWLYDRVRWRSLMVVPVISAGIPVLAFSATPGLAIVGVLLWGAVLGVQESTMRAAVADLVPPARRGTAYGVFAAGLGTATLIGSTLIGALYAYSIHLTVLVVAGVQVAALLLFVALNTRMLPVGKRC
ncbi:major facilitator superfamily protein [Longimycelium tulufanense]|uniref:Major facilitator superfamily protein n=1 Tax=Longimycelium tulufanense TaxID=907463 RepID=A0A8J3CD42_9PSEU|nr:MFS transporter [Longimycelium tulufanense]GGM51126.1 major facilitator superfamily protein [Longimycelium tulufanense]